MKNKKKYLWLFLSLALWLASLSAQNNRRDVVYLKNGSIIKGSILEMVPAGSVKIQVADGSVFVFTMSEVEKVEKENLIAPQSIHPSSEKPAGSGQETIKNSATHFDSTKKLEIYDRYFGCTYIYAGQKISRNEFSNILKSSKDSTAYSSYSRATSLSVVASITGGVSGFCLGYGITSKPTNSALILVGAGLFVTALIFESNSDKAMQEALSRFNASSSISYRCIPKNDIMNISSVQFEINIPI
jgi:hypothetical protein